MDKFIERDFDELREISFVSYYTRGLNGSFIAGGCFKNIFEKVPAKDIDVFFDNKTNYEEAIKKVTKWENVVKTYQNEKCTGFKDVSTGVSFELIKSVFGTMEEVINRFDFTITKFAFRKSFDGFNEQDEPEFSYEIVHHKDFFQHLSQKRLVIDNSAEELAFPFSTFDRMFRYAKYGYQPCRESKVKIINAIRLQENFKDGDVSKSMYDGGFD
ncbi:hypothetical protein G7062_11415 [Erysipelothrix sp. HDW6C]|uniref:hypothetical protein n=1 Tax=Erysipelothrix sp. HDW6C TaxID=2714930 RepID=UPI0014074D42|nr:hypothetical protein [Erysipelothrix sp. HDW6C]QIK70866.1 hypothetical protein G7062_11415 [Erysipelothrix sp. HDW6C]